MINSQRYMVLNPKDGSCLCFILYIFSWGCVNENAKITENGNENGYHFRTWNNC